MGAAGMRPELNGCGRTARPWRWAPFPGGAQPSGLTTAKPRPAAAGIWWRSNVRYARRAGEPVRRGEVEGVDGAQAELGAELGRSGQAAGVERHHPERVPVAVQRGGEPVVLGGVGG